MTVDENDRQTDIVLRGKKDKKDVLNKARGFREPLVRSLSFDGLRALKFNSSY